MRSLSAESSVDHLFIEQPSMPQLLSGIGHGYSICFDK